MKIKNLLLVGAAAVALAACSNKVDNNAANVADATPVEDTEDTVVTYAGEIPGADCTYQYNLVMEYDDNANEGDYVLTQTVVGDESVAPMVTKGDFKVMTSTDNDANVKYMQLTPDKDDNPADANTDVCYFLINEDGTITMVGADLQPAASGLNYTLSVVE